jgi:hypothetical protein
MSADGTSDQLPATMREILSKSLTLRGFINYDFVDLYPDFLETPLTSRFAPSSSHCNLFRSKTKPAGNDYGPIFPYRLARR